MAKKKKEEKPKEYTRRQLSHFKKQKRRQRIIYISGISVIVAIIVIVLAGWYLKEYRPMHQTVIKVGDSEFNTAYYIDMLEYYGSAYSSEYLDVINSTLPSIIIQNELIRLGAESLGITIEDDEIKQTLEENGLPENDVNMTIYRTQELETRLKDEYFGITVVPESADQLHILAMLVESESVANEARNRLINGENFSTMVAEYAQNSDSKDNEGDFGWHPASVLEADLGSSIPVDYALEAAVGELSQPLSDNESSKSVGYWLINVYARPSENESAVYAIYLSSQEQALEIRDRLEEGENVAHLAEEYSQHTESKEKYGDLGLLTKTDDTTTLVSTTFDEYIFNPDTETGVWSDPIQDTAFVTQGGYWLVEVVEKEDNRTLSDDDREYLISTAYNEWASDLWEQYEEDIDTDGLDDDILAWATERVSEALGD